MTRRSRSASAAAVVAGVVIAGSAGCGGATEESAAPTSAPAATDVAGGAGNPQRGKRIYIEQGCGNCHTFRAAGSRRRVGPDLDKSLKGDDASHIRESLVDPEAEIAEGYATAMAVDYGPDALSSQNRISEQDIADLTSFLLEERTGE